MLAKCVTCRRHAHRIFRIKIMCYNCGCEIPDDNMGKPEIKGASLTEKSFDEMAREWGMTVEETKKNVYKLLKKQFETSKL